VRRILAAYIDYATGPERTFRRAKTRRSAPDATTDIGPIVAISQAGGLHRRYERRAVSNSQVRVWFRSSVQSLRSVSDMRAREACSRTQTVFLNWLRDQNLVERLRRMKFPSVIIFCLHTGHFLRAKMIHSISEENTTFAWQ
jgi:hypothetical protein